MAIRFRGYTGATGYVQLSDGTFRLAPLTVDKMHESITVGVIATAMVIATLTAFVLELLVIIKIRHHLLSYKQTSIPLQNDIKLLFSSIVVFCAQLLLTLYYVAALCSVLSQNKDIHMFAHHLYIWICDLISLCGSFALFAISDTVRCKYLEFYRITTMARKLPTMARKRISINSFTLF
ncbi:serpentine type 7TM GPCR chemoreceptor srv domain-containing protein [Ditylenchus destructor]|nr:serpentine type 7TM GPCR chemoreceptor srv domain-containing protein [Ditylenchus destructor]